MILYAVDTGIKQQDRLQFVFTVVVLFLIMTARLKKIFFLDHPSKCLLLETYDWHTMHHFTPDAVLLVFASTKFDPADYIYEEYK